MTRVIVSANYYGTHKVIKKFDGCEEADQGLAELYMGMARNRGEAYGKFAQLYNQKEGNYACFYKGPQSEKTSAAECDYCVVVIETMDPTLFLDENIDKVLQPFEPTEFDAIRAIATGTIDFINKKVEPITALQLDKKIIDALIIGCLDRNINYSKTIAVVLPDENFEEMSRQFLKAIYLHLPYRSRAFSGCSINMPEHKNPWRSTFVFYHNANKPKDAITLNPNECQGALDAIQKQKTNMPIASQAYIEYISNCTEEERKALHDYFWKEIEGNGDINIFQDTSFSGFLKYGDEFMKLKNENKLPLSKRENKDLNVPPIQEPVNPLNVTEEDNQKMDLVLAKIRLILMSSSISEKDKLKKINDITNSVSYLFETTQLDETSIKL